MLIRRQILVAMTAVILLSGAIVSPASADTNLVTGDTAMVAYTGGDGLTLRTGPGGEAIAYLPDGYLMTIQDGFWADDGNYWYQVTVDLDSGWTSGYVLSDFVTSNAGGSTFVYEGDAAASEVPIIVNTGGEGLAMRANPWSSAGVLTSIPDGAWIEVLAPTIWDEAGVAWSQVRYAGMVGYAAADYLGYKLWFGGAATTVSNDLWIGALSVVRGTAGDGLNLRDGVYGNPLVILPEGTVGDVIDGPLWDIDGAAWWMISTEYGSGWAHGGYLVATTWAELAEGGGSGSGSALADAAMAYLGTPYVWGGISPAGFDCSGFTYYLMASVFGYDFPRPLEYQLESGYYVSSDQLLPGDLIFFRNTYTWGLSHIGIYIGNGQMISASGEHYAVGVSNLNDPYWLSRYMTARRVL